MHDLLTHRAGFTYFFLPKNPLRDRYRELAIDRIDTDAAPEMLRKLATLPLASDPSCSAGLRRGIGKRIGGRGHVTDVRVHAGRPEDAGSPSLRLQPESLP